MSGPDHASATSRRRSGLVARVLLLLGAVCAIGFAASGLRSEDQANAGAVLIARAGQTPDPGAQVAEGHARFDAARRRRSDPNLDVQEASSLLLSRSSPGRAVAVLNRATRQEPDNADAWALLQVARLRAGDRRGAARARAQLLRLDPTSGRRR